MQYQISWLALVNILQQTEIVDHAEASLLNKIQSLIAGLWVENGNAISLEYTGSGASSCYDVQPRIFSLIRRPLYKIQIDFSRLYLQLFQEAARQEDINVFMGVELKKSVKELRETALLKKKLRVRDLHQHPSTALRIFFFLRSILAPSNIKNTVTGFTPAMGWLAAFILLKKLLSLSTTEMMQRSRSSMDMAQLSPLLSDPADKGGKQVFLQAKLLEIDTSTIPVQSTRKSTPKSAGFEDHSSAKTRHASFN